MGYKNSSKNRNVTNQSNSIISNQSLIDKEIEDYDRRRVVSAYQKIKRKPYYWINYMKNKMIFIFIWFSKYIFKYQKQN